jgi:nucleotide-binding universal stress UspA family protein
MRKILVATDFSEPARVAVQRAGLLAAARGAEVVILHAFDPAAYDRVTEDALAEERTALRLLLDEACGGLARQGVSASSELVEGRAEEVIAHAAAAGGADVVLIGAHGRTGLRRVLLGSVAERLVRSCHVPVLVARGRAAGSFARVLCATDFTEHAERALEAALELTSPGGRVDVLHVTQLPTYSTDDLRVMAAATLIADLEAEARRSGDQLLARHRREGGVTVTFEHEHGRTRDAILARLEGGAHDLVALGSHGRSGAARLFLGSVAEAIIRHAPCSVLVAR